MPTSWMADMGGPAREATYVIRHQQIRNWLLLTQVCMSACSNLCMCEQQGFNTQKTQKIMLHSRTSNHSLVLRSGVKPLGLRALASWGTLLLLYVGHCQ